MVEYWTQRKHGETKRVVFIRGDDGLLQWPGTASRYTDAQLRYCEWTKEE